MELLAVLGVVGCEGLALGVGAHQEYQIRFLGVADWHCADGSNGLVHGIANFLIGIFRNGVSACPLSIFCVDKRHIPQMVIDSPGHHEHTQFISPGGHHRAGLADDAALLLQMTALQMGL